MECNRDEAVRARDIAEQKYAKQDFLGAKKFVLKAQQLFPGLEGLTQMLPVMEVHSVAQCKVGANETDWYGILQLEPGADDSTVKKQYRRLALLLHPDKNKALGAEAAFKLISEAWGILSDKTKRAVHDMKRGVKVKVSHSRVGMEANMQAFQTPFNAAPPAPVPVPAPAPNPPSHSTGTFWTSCPGCGTQYQYLRTYENYQLQCRKCMVVFMARDIHSGTPANGAAGYSWPPFETHRQDFNFNKPPPTTSGAFNGATASNGYMNGSFPSSYPHQASNAAFFSSAAAAAAAQSKVAAAAAAAAAASSAVPTNNLAADVVQQTYQKVKRERVEAEKENKRKEKEMRRKEKEDQRKDKEEQRKLRDKERAAEAMDRLRAKRKENETRDEFKRKVDVRRKLKRKKRQASDDEGEDLEDEDQKVEQVMQDDLSSPTLPRRRSARTKKSVATYKVDDVSEDSELEEFPASKRSKPDVEADGTQKSEENGREAGRHQAPSENGGKGKSIADANINHEKRGSGGSGVNGLDEFDGERGHRSATERNKVDQVGATRKDSSDSDILGTSRRFEGVARESKLYEREMHKVKPGKSSQQVESPSPEKGVNCEANQGGKVFKSEDFRDEKSPSKSPRTLRMRIKSPKVPFPSVHPVDKEEDQRPQKRVSPSPSAGSTFSCEKEDEEQDPDEEEETIEVPDPDFFDFDSSRTEKDILAGQIWAVYDDQDGMPRFYGRISRASTKPFKAHMCWLEVSNTSDKTRPWLADSGLSVTCGEFKVGKSTTMAQINTFSHIMVDRAAGKGMVKIYPKKDQVWAVFRDWDPEGRLGPIRVPKLHGEGTTYSYDMVVILSDFSEERGVKIVKLVKISGYKTLFHRQDGQDAIRFLKPADLQRFSHSVPVKRMDDSLVDSIHIPRGTLELDPASTPMDLIWGPTGQSR